jgi:hypothetical protein
MKRQAGRRAGAREGMYSACHFSGRFCASVVRTFGDREIDDLDMVSDACSPLSRFNAAADSTSNDWPYLFCKDGKWL